MKNIFSNGFLPHITKPTRYIWTDLCIPNRSHLYKRHRDTISIRHYNDVADHCGIYLVQIKKLGKTLVNDQVIGGINELNLETLKALLFSRDFKYVIESSSAEENLQHILDAYQTKLHRAFLLVKKMRDEKSMSPGYQKNELPYPEGKSN